MDTATIRQLTELNAQFYQTLAQDFSDTRHYSWPGWEKLVPYLEELTQNTSPIKVLDIGCGNGRLASFLQTRFPDAEFEYTGVDNSANLLKIAQERLDTLPFKSKLIEANLVEQLQQGQLLPDLNQQFDLITLFGVLHHIPSLELRQQLVAQVAPLVKPTGYLVFTNWLFLDSARLQRKLIEPQVVKLDPKKLDKNDYILDWNKGKTMYRYCHNVDEKELAQLVNLTELQLIEVYKADGKEGVVNRYVILKKVSE